MPCLTKNRLTRQELCATYNAPSDALDPTPALASTRTGAITYCDIMSTARPSSYMEPLDDREGRLSNDTNDRESGSIRTLEHEYYPVSDEETVDELENTDDNEPIHDAQLSPIIDATTDLEPATNPNLDMAHINNETPSSLHPRPRNSSAAEACCEPLLSNTASPQDRKEEELRQPSEKTTSVIWNPKWLRSVVLAVFAVLFLSMTIVLPLVLWYSICNDGIAKAREGLTPVWRFGPTIVPGLFSLVDIQVIHTTSVEILDSFNVNSNFSESYKEVLEDKSAYYTARAIYEFHKSYPFGASAEAAYQTFHIKDRDTTTSRGSIEIPLKVVVEGVFADLQCIKLENYTVTERPDKGPPGWPFWVDLEFEGCNKVIKKHLKYMKEKSFTAERADTWLEKVEVIDDGVNPEIKSIPNQERTPIAANMWNMVYRSIPTVEGYGAIQKDWVGGHRIADDNVHDPLVLTTAKPWDPPFRVPPLYYVDKNMRTLTTYPFFDSPIKDVESGVQANFMTLIFEPYGSLPIKALAEPTMEEAILHALEQKHSLLAAQLANFESRLPINEGNNGGISSNPSQLNLTATYPARPRLIQHSIPTYIIVTILAAVVLLNSWSLLSATMRRFGRLRRGWLLDMDVKSLAPEAFGSLAAIVNLLRGSNASEHLPVNTQELSEEELYAELFDLKFCLGWFRDMRGPEDSRCFTVGVLEDEKFVFLGGREES
ncbi:hypothetical protein CkaCkLH20_01724 [Colletotrichum karsti]|uniref:Uncharacterized protein n=1 Tax=Colletotrichum karsti TaxID=1095194 RepID=A0A9P6LQG1_9PEZI|nr:uncharacterized protein CkaCkLH20_01724 [Colletotrichum karsti]KAF9880682.1 hypothetical protein CkaCkLH20_01724 [Colletotrichum karsti]